MKYILVIGIEYKKYLNPAKLTLHIGNKFLDTFTLERDYSTTDDMRPRIGQPWFTQLLDSLDDKAASDELSPLWTDAPRPLPIFYKVYTLNDYDLEGFFNINVENDNSNYTNGFMTHSSWIKLTIVSLIPMDLISDNGKDFLKTNYRLERGFKKYLRRNNLSEDETLLPNHGLPWPIADYFEVKRKDEKFEKDGVKDHHCWIGGSFVARYPVHVKHKTKYFGRPGEKQFGLCHNFIDLSFLTIAWLGKQLNIYDEN